MEYWLPITWFGVIGFGILILLTWQFGWIDWSTAQG